MTEYRVFVYQHWHAQDADMDVFVTAADPSSALLSLMQRFGLSSAAFGHVWDGGFLVGRFQDITLPVLPSDDACVVSYDYTL
jgi:hypothetical protein